MAEATGSRIAPYTRMILAGTAGQAKPRLTAADRGRDRRRPRPRDRGSRRHTRTGRPRSCTTASAATRRRASAARQARGAPSPVRLHVGAARAGRGGRAHREHRARARRAGHGWRRRRSPAAPTSALGIEARCRALVSDGSSRRGLYREAIDRLSRTRLRPELARAHLLYGEWLRREGRRVDAREQLRTAYDMLAAIGMEAFAERARRELIATGEKVRKRSVETRDQLTAAGGADRPAGPRRPHQSGDRRPAVPSPRARSNGTCARSSPSSASAPAANCTPRWRAQDSRTSRASRGSQ